MAGLTSISSRFHFLRSRIFQTGIQYTPVDSNGDLFDFLRCLSHSASRSRSWVNVPKTASSSSASLWPSTLRRMHTLTDFLCMSMPAQRRYRYLHNALSAASHGRTEEKLEDFPFTCSLPRGRGYNPLCPAQLPESVRTRFTGGLLYKHQTDNGLSHSSRHSAQYRSLSWFSSPVVVTAMGDSQSHQNLSSFLPSKTKLV